MIALSTLADFVLRYEIMQEQGIRGTVTLRDISGSNVENFGHIPWV